MELNDIIDAILFKCAETRGYYQDIGVLADSVAGRVLSDSEKDDIEREIMDSGLLDQVGTGRKPSDVETVTMSFRIPIDTRAELNAFLKERGLSMADFVKAALNTMK